MELKKITISLLKGCSLFLFMGILVACQSGLFSAIGKTVKEEKQIPLYKGRSQDGIWQSNEILVQYHYIFDQKNLQLPGIIELNGYVGYRIPRLDFLTVSVNFLNTEGKILDYKLVYYSGYRVKYGKRTSFKSKLETPPHTTAMTFTYAYTATRGHR